MLQVLPSTESSTCVSTVQSLTANPAQPITSARPAPILSPSRATDPAVVLRAPPSKTTEPYADVPSTKLMMLILKAETRAVVRTAVLLTASAAPPIRQASLLVPSAYLATSFSTTVQLVPNSARSSAALSAILSTTVVPAPLV